MAAWTVKINSVTPSGNNLIISVFYYLATDTGFATPLGSDTVTVPNTVGAPAVAAAKAQIVAQASSYRTGYDLTAIYQGITVNVP